MQRLWHAATLRALDQATIAAGLPGAALMECAGAAAAEVIRERFGGAWRIVVVCGPGNNGGDGFVVARRLVADSFAASVALTAPETAYAGDAAAMLRAADAAGVPRSELTDAGDADLVVDAVFGTGFRDALEVLPFETDAPIVALDVPSGIDATSGVVRGEAVRAEITVCFGGRKLGTAIEPGRSHSGEVVTVPIGLIESLAPPEPDALLCTDEDLALLAQRDPVGSKYDAGSVLVVAGSAGMPGAASLAAAAALRSGAGLVRVVTRPSERAIVAGHLPEAMVIGSEDIEAILEYARGAGAVVAGPGLGRDTHAAVLVEALVRDVDAPLLLDADALFMLAGRLELLRDRARPVVLTPHAGELARLLGVSSSDVRSRRLERLQQAVAAAGGVVLLKGPDTLVTAPGEPLRVVETAVPQLATAGAGDVLAGVAGALLARGGPGAQTVALAAVAHGAAARSAAGVNGTLLASDLLAPLGRLLG